MVDQNFEGEVYYLEFEDEMVTNSTSQRTLF